MPGPCWPADSRSGRPPSAKACAACARPGSSRTAPTGTPSPSPSRHAPGRPPPRPAPAGRPPPRNGGRHPPPTCPERPARYPGRQRNPLTGPPALDQNPGRGERPAVAAAPGAVRTGGHQLRRIPAAAAGHEQLRSEVASKTSCRVKGALTSASPGVGSRLPPSSIRPARSWSVCARSACSPKVRQ